MIPPILLIASPTPQDRAFLADLLPIARQRGWVAVISDAGRGGCEASIAFIHRLDPDLDALLLLPHYISSHAALQEYSYANVRGIECFRPLSSPEALPEAKSRPICPHYRSIHYETDDRDSCDCKRPQCPRGKTCPIRRRCR